MGNNTYLSLNKGVVTSKSYANQGGVSYAHKNGIAMLWPFLFSHDDIIDLEIEEEGKYKTYPFIIANSAVAADRLGLCANIFTERYGDTAMKLINELDVNLHSSVQVSLNLVEYYMFGFNGMTDRDVAEEIVSMGMRREWDELEEISNYSVISIRGNPEWAILGSGW